MIQPMTVAFHSVKGGVGKTTLLAQWSVHLASMGLRVLALDADLEAPSLDVVLACDPFRLKGEDSYETSGDLISILNFLDEKSERSKIDANVDKQVASALFDVSALWQNLAYGKGQDRKDMLTRFDKTIFWNGFQSSGELDGSAYFKKLVEPINKNAGAIWLLPSGRNVDKICGLVYKSELSDHLEYVLEKAVKLTDPDIILIDCRSGLSDAAAVALGLADVVVNVTLPKMQHVLATYMGMEWISLKKWGSKHCIVFNMCVEKMSEYYDRFTTLLLSGKSFIPTLEGCIFCFSLNYGDLVRPSAWGPHGYNLDSLALLDFVGSLNDKSKAEWEIEKYVGERILGLMRKVRNNLEVLGLPPEKREEYLRKISD